MINEYTEHDTPDLPEDPDFFKDHFLGYDALRNVTNELVFSTTKRYMCKAGCKMCYVQKDWPTDEEFGVMVPPFIPPETEEQILKFFKHFTIVSTMDDLFWLKRKHPHLFDFYKRNSHHFCSTAMTDNAFLQQYDIIMNEMNFSSIYEISFSDIFLAKKSGQLADDLVAKLEIMHSKTPLLKLKIIFCTDDGEKQDAVIKLIDWAHSHNIHVCIHDDITQDRNNKWKLEQADYQQFTYYSEDSDAYQILGEVVHLQYTSVFHTISQAIAINSRPFYDIVTDGADNVERLVYNSLLTKVDMYKQYISKIRNRDDNKYFNYFSYVASSVEINKNFNFIPIILLKPWTSLYNAFVQQGWIDHKFGLFLPTKNNGDVIPLITIKDTIIKTKNDTQI